MCLLEIMHGVQFWILKLNFCFVKTKSRDVCCHLYLSWMEFEMVCHGIRLECIIKKHKNQT